MFPHFVKKMIRFEINKQGEVIEYTDGRFANQALCGDAYCKANKGDIIFIEYIPEDMPCVICTLKIADINEYYCDIYRINRERERMGQPMCTLDGVRLNITENPLEHYRYLVDGSRDYFGVFANEVILENLKYTK